MNLNFGLFSYKYSTDWLVKQFLSIISQLFKIILRIGEKSFLFPVENHLGRDI